MIVLWSRHSVESNYVQNEASEADARGVLVPVMLEQVRIPLPFRHLHATPIEELDHIVSSLRSSIAPQSAPPPVATSSRQTLWFWSVIVALMVGVSIIAALKQQPETVATQVSSDTSSSATTTTTADPIKAGPVNAVPVNANPTNANPTNAIPETAVPLPKKGLRLTLHNDVPGVESYMVEGDGFASDDLFKVGEQDVELSIRCVNLDCAHVRVALDTMTISPAAVGRFQIPRSQIPASPVSLRVLVRNLEVFRIKLIR